MPSGVSYTRADLGAHYAVSNRCCHLGGGYARAVASQTVQPREPFTLALTGDSIITQRLSVFKEPEFTRLFDMIRGADAAFTNLETLFHDYEMPPAHESGGTWMRTDPPILKELVWAGFDLVSRANNHAGDFGPPARRSPAATCARPVSSKPVSATASPKRAKRSFSRHRRRASR